MIYNSSELIGNRNSGSSVGGVELYNKRADLVLNSLSDSYSLFELISVNTSRLFSCPISYCLLII